MSLLDRVRQMLGRQPPCADSELERLRRRRIEQEARLDRLEAEVELISRGRWGRRETGR